MTHDPQQLAALEALARAATPGPWSVEDNFIDFDAMGHQDAAYIAALSPDVVLALVAAARERDELRARLDRYEPPRPPDAPDCWDDCDACDMRDPPPNTDGE